MTEQTRQYSKETMDEIIRSLRADAEQTRNLINKIHEETLDAVKDTSNAIEKLEQKVEKQNELMMDRVRKLEASDNKNVGFKTAIGWVVGILGGTVISGIIYVFVAIQDIQIILAKLK